MRNLVVFIIGGFFALTRGDTKELVLVCPAEIPAASIRGMEIQPGWRLFNPNRLKLYSASFIGGKPEEMLDLVPFQIVKNTGGTLERWKFDKEEVWLRCAYGAAGQITLSRKVEGKQAECSITYDRNLVLRIVCSDE